MCANRRGPWFSNEEEKLDFEVELFYLTVAEKIAKLLESQNVTQTELAKRLNVSKSFVTKVLSGEANLTLRTLYRIFHHLGRKVDLKPAIYVDELDYAGDKTVDETTWEYKTIQAMARGTNFVTEFTRKDESTVVNDEDYSIAA